MVICLKKMILGGALMLSMFLLSCSFFTDKPSDKQIIGNVGQYIVANYKQFKTNNISIRGLLFSNDKEMASKVAHAIVDVKLECVIDIRPKDRTFSNLIQLYRFGFDDENHNKGDLLSLVIDQKYIKSDRGWLPLEINEGSDVKMEWKKK
jgi:hypothetical protein